VLEKDEEEREALGTPAGKRVGQCKNISCPDLRKVKSHCNYQLQFLCFLTSTGHCLRSPARTGAAR
jgi:hypothetical protein